MKSRLRDSWGGFLFCGLIVCSIAACPFALSDTRYQFGDAKEFKTRMADISDADLKRE